VGAELPLRADAGCRNTVFNNRAQTGAEYVARLLELGVRSYRVEFVNESPDEVARTLARYAQLLRGEITGAELWRELKLINQLGVTRGQMEAAPQIIAKKSQGVLNGSSEGAKCDSPGRSPGWRVGFSSP